MYELYPFFNKTICSISQIEDIEAHTNMILFLNNQSPNYCKSEEDIAKGAYAFHAIIDRKFGFKNKNCLPYFSILIFDNIKNTDISNINNLSQSIGRTSIYHEFGHLLDTFLNISNSNKLNEIIENHNIKKEISEYACTNNMELVACAFSKYILSMKKLTNLEKQLGKIDFCNSDYVATPLVNEIGNLIDNEYKKFIKFKQLKFINKRYDFNKKFTIQKNYEKIDIQEIKNKVKELRL